jgi:large subunit ribosomal protein L3
MAGHMGAKSVTTPNVKVVKIDQELGLLLVKGSVPGPSNGVVYVRDALRKPMPVTAAQ